MMNSRQQPKRKGGCAVRASILPPLPYSYHFGKFLFVHDPDRMREAHDLAITAHGRALPNMDPPGERVVIPYEDTWLAGVFRKPRGVERPPVVIMCMGLDSAKEEMHTNEAVFLDRGVATLAIRRSRDRDEAEYDLPIRPDYEAPISSVIDWLEERDRCRRRACRALGSQPQWLLCSPCRGLRAARAGLHFSDRTLRFLRGIHARTRSDSRGLHCPQPFIRRVCGGRCGCSE